ncbi:YbaB/EbfC family nucleoid-associated protein [Actinacidiphila yeochonensis]|uniref:YbaB/EbfC family nucleoid-associated protein n=1 Tax=Actinacidiphila yeochonensis TaxID=89050 RepID=UPI000689E13D|nr:YbaB/EbfC family nucleoid-associated protein [Actinacidiphila yeochonensis]
MSENPMADFAALTRRAMDMNRAVTSAHAEMEKMEAAGYGGGGMVRAVVSGENRLVALDIDPSVIDPENPRALSEMVMAAVDEANESLAAERATRMREVTGGLTDIVDQLTRTPSSYNGPVMPKTPARRSDGRQSPLPYLPRLPGTDGTR